MSKLQPDDCPTPGPHSAPTSCSWLNAVGGFFAKLAKRRLKHGVFHSLVDFQAATSRFIAEHSRDNPRALPMDRGPRRNHRRGQAWPLGARLKHM
ncbi:hypothetical protein SPHV1_180028 [Novosphingobium sp. KN65.2]|nr:hypothetical protein SPHV1_180028 [Novosphingobium sp. KN65.2]